MHITFIPMSDGGSYYTTSSATLQKVLESDYQFNRTYTLVKEEKEPVHVDAPKAPKLEPLTLPDLMAARDYVSKKWQIPRTSLKSKAAIVAAAQKRGFDLIIG